MLPTTLLSGIKENQTRSSQTTLLNKQPTSSLTKCDKKTCKFYFASLLFFGIFLFFSYLSLPQSFLYAFFTATFKFLEKIRSQPSTHSIPRYSQAIVHLNHYLVDGLMSEDTDVIAFWEKYNSCEELRTIVLKYLVMPATSVPSECVNSTAGNTITDKRSRLSPNLAEQLVPNNIY